MQAKGYRVSVPLSFLERIGAQAELPSSSFLLYTTAMKIVKVWKAETYHHQGGWRLAGGRLRENP